MAVCRELIGVSLAFCLLSCSGEGGQGESENEPLQMDVRIQGAADQPEATVLVRFHPLETDSSRPVSLAGQVLLDGKRLPADSTAAGVFYELRLPPEQLAGRHQLEVQRERGKLSAFFTFQPFRSSGNWPEALSLGGFSLPVAGLPDGARVLVALVDTSYNSEDLHFADTIRNAALRVQGTQMQGLRSGPALLQLTSSRRHSLPEQAGIRGIIHTEYTFSREVSLQQ